MIWYGVYLKDLERNVLMGCEAIFPTYKRAAEHANKTFVRKYETTILDKRVIVPDWEIVKMNVSRCDGKVGWTDY